MLLPLATCQWETVLKPAVTWNLAVKLDMKLDVGYEGDLLVRLYGVWCESALAARQLPVLHQVPGSVQKYRWLQFADARLVKKGVDLLGGPHAKEAAEAGFEITVWVL